MLTREQFQAMQHGRNCAGSTPGNNHLCTCGYARWCFDLPDGEGDCRKIVTLQTRDGMTWVGIRAWSSDRQCWLNNGVLEQDRVVAWQPLMKPAVSDGLMSPMSAPTLGDHWTT